MSENKFKITVLHNDEMDAFGAYLAGTIKENETGGIVLFNIEASLEASIVHDIKFKEILIETLIHEVGHSLEEWYGLNFNEKRIERMVESYRAKYKDYKPEIKISFWRKIYYKLFK